jgi:hypothetical protein
MLPTVGDEKPQVARLKLRSTWISAERRKSIQRFLYDHWLQLTTFAILIALLILFIIGAIWTLEHHSPKRNRQKNKHHAALAREWYNSQVNENQGVVDSLAQAITDEMTEIGDLE